MCITFKCIANPNVMFHHIICHQARFLTCWHFCLRKAFTTRRVNTEKNIDDTILPCNFSEAIERAAKGFCGQNPNKGGCVSSICMLVI